MRIIFLNKTVAELRLIFLNQIQIYKALEAYRFREMQILIPNLEFHNIIADLVVRIKSRLILVLIKVV